MYYFSLVIIKDQKQSEIEALEQDVKRIADSIWKTLFIKLEVDSNYIRDEYECWNEGEEKRNENKGNKENVSRNSTRPQGDWDRWGVSLAQAGKLTWKRRKGTLVSVCVDELDIRKMKGGKEVEGIHSSGFLSSLKW